MKHDKSLKQVQKLLDVAEGNLHSARNLLLDILGGGATGLVDHIESAKDLSILEDGKIIEGVFDGEQMIAPDGKKYPVPANYASKSKLVEGDTLKLTIADDGGLIYKQINPIERKNLIGVLSYENGNYSVLAEGKKYKVLFASVTYYKGEPGNKASVVIPADKASQWAALESVIHEHAKEEEKVEKKEDEDEIPVLELPKENLEILKGVKETLEPKDPSENVEAVESKEETPNANDAEIPPPVARKLPVSIEEETEGTTPIAEKTAVATDTPTKINNQHNEFLTDDVTLSKKETDTNIKEEKKDKGTDSDSKVEELDI